MTDYWDTHRFRLQAAASDYALTADDAYRFELRAGDVALAGDHTNERAEMSADYAMYIGPTYAISYSFKIDPGEANTASFLKFNQIHQADDAWDRSASPELDLGLDGERFAVRVNGQAGVVTDNGRPSTLVYEAPTDLSRGEWHTVDIQVKLGPAGDGALTVALDGQAVVDYTGAIGYNDAASAYWKMGIYRGAAPETMAVEFKDFQMSDFRTSRGDVLNGTPRADSLFGYAGDDQLSGGGGNDLLRGGRGDDHLWGGAGDDWLSGDAGTDLLKGGAGHDTFFFAPGSGTDRIEDFDKKSDSIEIAPGATYTLEWDGHDTTVNLGDGDRLVVTGSHIYAWDHLIWT